MLIFTVLLCGFWWFWYHSRAIWRRFQMLPILSKSKNWSTKNTTNAIGSAYLIFKSVRLVEVLLAATSITSIKICLFKEVHYSWRWKNIWFEDICHSRPYLRRFCMKAQFDTIYSNYWMLTIIIYEKIPFSIHYLWLLSTLGWILVGFWWIASFLEAFGFTF